MRSTARRLKRASMSIARSRSGMTFEEAREVIDLADRLKV
jgi:hypothetical protein